MKRKSLVVANWKMNILPSKAYELANEIKVLSRYSGVEVVVAPPYTHLALLSELRDQNFSIGAQNVHFARFGAYTGGISAEMLVDLKVEFVILGHSERREAYPSESDFIADKIGTCLNAGIKVIYCCGEPEKVRKDGDAENYVLSQLEYDFRKLTHWQERQLNIAYEPIWAIGTGLTATAEQAQQMHLNIRNWISRQYGINPSENTRILYGGSVKSTNVLAFAAMPDIDGALVGGASLDASEFNSIVSAFSEVFELPKGIK